MDDEFFSVIIAILILAEASELLKVIEDNSRKRNIRRSYEHRSRHLHGCIATHFERLYNDDPVGFKKSVGMSTEVFNTLLNFVKGELTKNSYKAVISPKCRLFLTLMYLSNGGSKQLFSMAFQLGLTSVNRIVKETCDVLWNTLSHIYLPVPNKTEWKQISDDFKTMWNLPNCVGAIDWKHFDISWPSNSGSYSIMFLGTCDSNYNFTGIDIGTCGSQNDSSILWQLGFGQRFFDNQIDLPKKQNLPNSDMSFPHYFVGDASFPLKPFLMRPYPGRQLFKDRENFNKRLSRAKQVIDNAFGILMSRWKILHGPLIMSPESMEKVVKAVALLHNFVKTHDATYIPPDYVDHYDGENLIYGQWRKQAYVQLKKPKKVFSNNAARNAFILRDQLKDYLLYD